MIRWLKCTLGRHDWARGFCQGEKCGKPMQVCIHCYLMTHD